MPADTNGDTSVFHLPEIVGKLVCGVSGSVAMEVRVGPEGKLLTIDLLGAKSEVESFLLVQAERPEGLPGFPDMIWAFRGHVLQCPNFRRLGCERATALIRSRVLAAERNM